MKHILSIIFVSIFIFIFKAHSDIVIVEKQDNEGIKGIGASQGQVQKWIKKEKSREEKNMKFKGRMARWLTKKESGNTVVITRVDLDKIWTLSPSKNTYTERPVSFRFEKTPQQDPSPEPQKSDSPSFKVKETAFEVQKTNEEEVFTGSNNQKWNTKKWIITMEVVTQDLETNKQKMNQLKSTLWITPWTPLLEKVKKEQDDFNKSYVKKMGLDLSPYSLDIGGLSMATSIMGTDPESSQKQAKEFKEKLKAMNGFPIKTEYAWYQDSDEPDPTPEETLNPIDVTQSPEQLAKGLFSGFAKKKVNEKINKKLTKFKEKPVSAGTVIIQNIEDNPLSDELFEIPKTFKIAKPS